MYLAMDLEGGDLLAVYQWNLQSSDSQFVKQVCGQSRHYMSERDVCWAVCEGSYNSQNGMEQERVVKQINSTLLNLDSS